MIHLEKPIIGIISRPAILDKISILKINESVRLAINNFGGIALGILPCQNFEYNKISPENVDKLTDKEKQDIIEQIKLCDGIIMPGGNKWYEYDEFISSYAIENDIPILGLCMGMQILASTSTDSDKIINDNTVKNATTINHNQPNVNYVHSVYIKANTLLYDIFQKDIILVNSRHSYHCEKINTFLPSAYASDGLLEAVELPDKNFVLGVQWHPEDMISYDQDEYKIFKYFINKCIKYKQKKA